MRRTIVVLAAAALLPTAALAEEKKDEQPGLVEALGVTAAGALGYSAGAAGGPLGSAVGGIVGQKLGKGLIGGVKRLFGGRKDEPAPDVAQAPAEPPQPEAAAAADHGAPASDVAATQIALEPPAPAAVEPALPAPDVVVGGPVAIPSAEPASP